MAGSLAIAILCSVAALPQQVVVPRQPPVLVAPGQQVFSPRAEPQLPTDEELMTVSVAPELLRLVRALDSDSFSERDAARQAIIARKPAPDELMAVLLRRDLSDEGRHQLVGILRDRILRAPRGALGIRMENFPDKDGGVRITALVPGMPAEKVLKPGDVVKRVNDTVLRSTIDLMNAVQTLPPGVEVKLLVRRVRKDALAAVAPAGAPAQDPAQLTEDLELTMRLGSTEELQEKGDPVLPGVAGQQVLLGGGGLIFYERQLRALMASKRFLSKPQAVEFPLRDSGATEKPAVTVESVRKLLMELQLADGDADRSAVGRAGAAAARARGARGRDPRFVLIFAATSESACLPERRARFTHATCRQSEQRRAPCGNAAAATSESACFPGRRARFTRAASVQREPPQPRPLKTTDCGNARSGSAPPPRGRAAAPRRASPSRSPRARSPSDRSRARGASPSRTPRSAGG